MGQKSPGCPSTGMLDWEGGDNRRISPLNRRALKVNLMIFQAFFRKMNLLNGFFFLRQV
jgi:hypothetical protein